MNKCLNQKIFLLIFKYHSFLQRDDTRPVKQFQISENLVEGSKEREFLNLVEAVQESVEENGRKGTIAVHCR